MRRLLVTLSAAASLLFAGQAAAATFYVSPNGSDDAAGTSAASAWKTVAKVDAARLAPGDTVLFQGGPTFTGNQILDTGLDRSLGYKRHGVYDIGTNIVWRNNVIRRFSEGGFSLRARGNTLVGNVITDGPYAIYYSPYDSTPGKTTIA